MPPFFIRFKTRSRQKRGIYKSFPKTDKSKNHRNAEKKPDEQSRKRGKYQKVQKYFEPFFQSAAVHNGVAGKKARQSENQPRHAADNRRSVAYFRRVKPESRAEAQKQQRSEDEQIFVPAYMPENLQLHIFSQEIQTPHLLSKPLLFPFLFPLQIYHQAG